MVFKELDVSGELKANILHLYIVCISMTQEARIFYQNAAIYSEFYFPTLIQGFLPGWGLALGEAALGGSMTGSKGQTQCSQIPPNLCGAWWSGRRFPAMSKYPSSSSTLTLKSFDWWKLHSIETEISLYTCVFFKSFIYYLYYFFKVTSLGAHGKESASLCRRHGFDPWVGKVPWRGKWQPILVFLLEKFNVQRSLVGNSPRGHKESDTTEWLNTFIFKILTMIYAMSKHLFSKEPNFGSWKPWFSKSLVITIVLNIYLLGKRGGWGY